MSKGNWLRRRVKALSLRTPFSSNQGDDSSFTSTRSVFFLTQLIRKLVDFSTAATLNYEHQTLRGSCSASSNWCSSTSSLRRQKGEQHALARLVCADRSRTRLQSSSGDNSPPCSRYGTRSAISHAGFRQETRWKRDVKRLRPRYPSFPWHVNSLTIILLQILRSRCYESPGVAQYILPYVNRVRSMTDIRLTSAEQNLISVLANSAAYSPLLPLLNAMQLSFDAPGAPTLCLVASLTLERLEVRIDKRHFNSQDLPMALDVLGVRALSLRFLAISMIPDDMARFIGAILHFPKLGSIKVDQPITSSTLELLGTVKPIHTMSVVVAGHGDWIDAVVDMPTLRTLLCTGSSKALGALVTAIHAPALSKLDMTTRAPSDAVADYASLIQTVGTSIAGGSVRTLSLTMHPRDPSRVQTRSATPISTFLRPWLSLPQLERVSFVLGCYSTITAEDTDFRTFADAWSGLERLTVRGCATIRRRGFSGDWCPSRETAGYLARRCPQLASLELNGVFARIERGAS